MAQIQNVFEGGPEFFKQGESKVILEIDTPLTELMVKLNCEHGLILQAEKYNLYASYKETGVQVEYHGQGGKKISKTAPIKLGVLVSIIQDKVSDGGATHILARTGLQKAVEFVLNEISAKQTTKTEANSDADVFENLLEPVVTDVISDLSKIFLAKNDNNTISTWGQIVTPPQFAALKDATELLQPVKGSDEGSQYFVIALSPIVKVAARIKSSVNFSVRVEGNGLKNLKNTLKSVGFADNGTHMSVHLSAGTDMALAQKCIGALLYGIGIQFDKVLTDLSLIWGKGA